MIDFSRPSRRHLLAMLSVFLLLMLLCGAALADQGDWPELNSDGFLSEGEFLYEDPENGLWRYCSTTLKVEIIRYSYLKPNHEIWYEAEVWSAAGGFGLITAVPGEHFTKVDWPQNVCTANGSVLAINGDYSCGRWSNMRYKKERYKLGIQIRDGVIINDQSRKSGSTTFPNLDTLAFYPDGNMEVNNSLDVSAEEFIQKGASDVISFGPWLLRDGELNPNLSKFNNSRAPRTVIGMVEKGHYFAMMVEGRHKLSNGGDHFFLAEKLKEHGCQTAFNLDGGETACILFMGKQINKVGSCHNSNGFARKGAEFISIGTSTLVEGYVPAEN